MQQLYLGQLRLLKHFARQQASEILKFGSRCIPLTEAQPVEKMALMKLSAACCTAFPKDMCNFACSAPCLVPCNILPHISFASMGFYQARAALKPIGIDLERKENQRNTYR